MKITLATILSWGPCWDPTQISNYTQVHGKGPWTPLELLDLPELSMEDRLWLVFRPEVIPELELRLLCCDFADHVLPLWEAKYPSDSRPRDAIATARRFAIGDATPAELTAARAAAWAAWDAAWAAEASGAAAKAAAWAAWDAAWAAAGAAWAAAGAAAWDAEQAWQVARIRASLIQASAQGPSAEEGETCDRCGSPGDLRLSGLVLCAACSLLAPDGCTNPECWAEGDCEICPDFGSEGCEPCEREGEGERWEHQREDRVEDEGAASESTFPRVVAAIGEPYPSPDDGAEPSESDLELLDSALGWSNNETPYTKGSSPALAWLEGRTAGATTKIPLSNPHTYGTEQALAWLSGWCDGRNTIQRTRKGGE